MVTENIDANTIYTQSKVETEQLSYTVRYSTYLLGQRMSLGKTNGEVNISHETTTMVVWIYDGI